MSTLRLHRMAGVVADIEGILIAYDCVLQSAQMGRVNVTSKMRQDIGM